MLAHHTDRSATRLAPHPPAAAASPLRWSCLALAAVLASGCANLSEREQGTARGAAVGSVAGAVLGAVTGGNAGGSAVLGGVVGAVAGNLWSKRMEDKREALARASAGTGIEVARTTDNQLKLNIPGDFSFDVGRASIKPAMRPLLDEIGRNMDHQVKVTIVGHTDSTGGDAVNQPLSVDRAEAVRDYLSVRGVSAARVAVQGRGSREPVASNDSDAGRAMNRRVEIFLAEQAAAS